MTYCMCELSSQPSNTKIPHTSQWTVGDYDDVHTNLSPTPSSKNCFLWACTRWPCLHGFWKSSVQFRGSWLDLDKNTWELNMLKCMVGLLSKSKYLSMFPIELYGGKTNPAKSARNLGVIFDKNFTFRSHVSGVCSSCFYHMWNLRCIRRHLDLDSATWLPTALVSSRLDHCNSLLYGIANIDLIRLQHVQNQLARLVTKSPPFTHSVPLLRSFHNIYNIVSDQFVDL